MDQWLAYGGLALVIALLVLLDWYKSRPVRDAAHRFSLDFWEVREHALGASPPLPRTEQAGDGLALSPDQDAEVWAALAAGADRFTAGRDARMEQSLRDMFQGAGKSAHLKRRYYDYCDNLFVLHRLFLRVCADPSVPLTREEWEDLARYWRDRERMRQLAQERAAGPIKRSELDEAI